MTKGDLTRSIQVETRGEVAEALKDNINTMIDNLRGTTERNQEQDWLKTNLAKFTRMLQGQARSGHSRRDAAERTGPAGQCPAGNSLSRCGPVKGLPTHRSGHGVMLRLLGAPMPIGPISR